MMESYHMDFVCWNFPSANEEEEEEEEKKKKNSISLESFWLFVFANEHNWHDLDTNP